MGTFLMFFAFSDPVPSYPFNFPSNTTNMSIWTCLLCSRVPSSPTKNPSPCRTHKTRLYQRVLCVWHPPLPPTLLLPFLSLTFLCLHYFIPSNTKACPSGCSWSLKGENASSFNPEHRRMPRTAYFDVWLSSSPQPHHTTIQPIFPMSLHFLSLPHLCHLLR